MSKKSRQLAERRQGEVRATRTVSTAQLYSGPIPPAGQLAQYEDVLPGLADRIVGMAERNAAHRHSLEKAVVEGNVRAQARGQVCAFILALVVLGVGCWLLIEGKTGLGLWLMLGDVLALAGVFLGARWMQKKERESRRQELEGRGQGR